MLIGTEQQPAEDTRHKSGTQHALESQLSPVQMQMRLHSKLDHVECAYLGESSSEESLSDSLGFSKVSCTYVTPRSPVFLVLVRNDSHRMVSGAAAMA